jgi:biotin-(acetyl-CoA carboxylase) ligase
VARELLRTFDREYAAFIKGKDMHITKRWSNLSALSGKRIRVYLAHKAIEGQAQDIDAQGALILRLDNGFKQHIFAADAIKVR